MDLTTDQWNIAAIVGIYLSAGMLVIIAGIITYGMTHSRSRSDSDDSSDPAKNPIIVFLYKEPAMLAGFVGAAAALTATFGMELSSDQVGAIIAFISIVLAIIVRQSVYSPETVERSGLTYDRNSETLEDTT